MATTEADGYTTKAFKGTGRQLCVLDAEHEVTAAQLALSEVIKIGVVPSGSIYVGGYIATDDLDSNATPTLVLDVGDDDDSDGLMDGATTGQAAAITDFNGTYLTNKTTVDAEKTISVTVQTAAATAAAGTMRVVVYYYVP